MADRKFTLLELYLDEIQIGPSALGDITAAESSPDTESDADADETGGCPGKKVGTLLAVLLVLALVAVAAKKLLGGGVEDLDELDDLTDFDE